MNFNWKFYLFVALLTIVLVTGLLAWHFYGQLQAEKQKTSLINDAKTDFKAEAAQTFTDRSGIKHLVAPAGQHTFSASTIAANPKQSLGGADTSAMALDIQRQQIEQWQSIALKNEARALKAEVKRDSLGRLVRFYKDKFIEITYHPPQDSTGAGNFDYKSNENLVITQYWKRSWLLGPKHSFIDISSDNPFTSISGLKTLTITPDQPKFNLTGQVRASYDFASGTVIPSAGVLVTAGSFDFGGRYYYSQRYQKWTPIISATYNFFKLK